MSTLPELLQLDDNSVALRQHLAQTALLLHSMALRASYSDEQAQKIYRRLQSPVAGDMVYERTRAVYSDDLDVVAVGTGMYLRQVREPLFEDKEWEEEITARNEASVEVQIPPTHTVHYVQYGPDNEDIARWENARVYVIPMGIDFFEQ